MNPIVIAYHLVWTAYGWWLPNDPRGSMSSFVASDALADLGELHYGRRRIQPAGRVVSAFYARAADRLSHSVMTFNDGEIAVIAAAFAAVVAEFRYTCYAAAIMPDHIHLIVRKHRDSAEQMTDNFQRLSRFALVDHDRVGTDHPTWGGPGWKVFLDEPDDVWRTKSYVERNPVKIGRPRQDWPFVAPYDNWPFHPGHSPNSPYARRLRGR